MVVDGDGLEGRRDAAAAAAREELGDGEGPGLAVAEPLAAAERDLRAGVDAAPRVRGHGAREGLERRERVGGRRVLGRLEEVPGVRAGLERRRVADERSERREDRRRRPDAEQGLVLERRARVEPDLGGKRARTSQLQRLPSRPRSTRFG